MGWFVARLARALRAECERLGLAVVSEACHGEPEAPRSIALILQGDCAPLRGLEGSHCWVHRSPRRGKRTRKRWFAGVSLHPVDAEPSIVVAPEDIEIRTCRSGGAGGQHVNKTESAVMVRYLPTGLVLRADGERSQHRNRKAALTRLSALLIQQGELAQGEARAKRRRAHHEVSRGAPVRTWEGVDELHPV